MSDLKDLLQWEARDAYAAANKAEARDAEIFRSARQEIQSWIDRNGLNKYALGSTPSFFDYVGHVFEDQHEFPPVLRNGPRKNIVNAHFAKFLEIEAELKAGADRDQLRRLVAYFAGSVGGLSSPKFAAEAFFVREAIRLLEQSPNSNSEPKT